MPRQPICLWAITIFISTFTAASVAPGSDQAAISSDGKILALAHEGKRARIPVDDYVDAQADFESRELYRQQIGTELHLLVEVVGRSRANDGSGQCGGGGELNLIYLRLSEKLDPLEIESELIHSCWKTRSNELWLELREIGELFEVAFQESGSVTYLQFDKKLPHRGLERVRFSVPRGWIAPFVSFMPPGEARVIEVAHDLPLRVQPSPDAEQVTASPIRKNTPFRYGRSVVLVTAPGRLRVTADTSINGMHYGSPRLLTREDYYHPRHDRRTLQLEVDDLVEYLQYRAEGYRLVRFEGGIYEVDELDDAFVWISPTDSEWWVEVIDDERRPRGWVLVDDEAVR